ncbi:outer membrane protein transport protein [Myxococcota bacterium]|nr:outer membrane protein transport protein [Myxococcota bacterium]
MRLTPPLLLLIALSLPCGPAMAGGFESEYADNGAVALGRAGAFVASADDATALQHNPAGLAQLRGAGVLLGLHLVDLHHRFEPASDVIKYDVTRTFGAIEQQAGPFPAPMIFGHMALSRRLQLGLGVYGPPGTGRRVYPDQLQITSATRASGADALDGLKGAASSALAPNGLLVSSDMQLAFISAALGFAVTPALRLGITLQATYFKGEIQQAIGGVRPALNTIRLEDPFTPALILGAQYAPHPRLTLGLTARPPVALEPEGEVDIRLYQIPCPDGPCPEDREQISLGPYQLGEPLRLYDQSGAVEQGISMPLTLPFVLRAGARYAAAAPHGEAPSWDIELAYVYERLSIHEALSPRFKGHSAALPLGEGGQTQPISPLPAIDDPRHYNDTHSLRLGGSLRLLVPLTLRLGAAWTNAASPSAYTHLDFPGLEQRQLSAGLGAHWGDLSVDLGYAFVYLVPRDVNDSDVRLIDLTAGREDWKVVGGGHFEGRYHIFGLNLSYAMAH